MVHEIPTDDGDRDLGLCVVYALIFVPVLGMVLSRKRKKGLKPDIAESGQFGFSIGLAGGYYKTLAFMVRHPAKVLFWRWWVSVRPTPRMVPLVRA